jgi:hypothetical protein
VQVVVRRSSAHSSFDIWSATGQAQLEASEVFNREFPAYLREHMEALLPKPAAPAATPGSDDWADAALEFLMETLTYKYVFSEYSKADIKKASAAAKKGGQADLAAELQVVAANYSELTAWLEGAALEGGTVEQEGMIPLHKALLRIMLDAGWDWGGDWTSAKDYMHFEDLAATTAISATPAPSGHP